MSTYFHKRVFPKLWLGLAAAGLIAAIIIGRNNLPLGSFIAAGTIPLGVFGYAVLKHLVSDVVDEVWDCGNEFVIRNQDIEERIEITDLVTAKYISGNPQRISLILRRSSVFGMEIIFWPRAEWFPVGAPRIVYELITRIAAAKSYVDD